MEHTIKSSKKTEKGNIFYTVAMRGVVAFPKMVMHFDIARDKSVASVEKALKENGKLFLVAQHETDVEDPKESDIYKTGVVAEIVPPKTWYLCWRCTAGAR